MLASTAPGRPADPAGVVHVTLVVRRREPLAEPGPGRALTQPELAARHGADPSDLRRVREVVTAAGATVEEVDAGTRRVRVAGRVPVLEQLFGTSLERATVVEDGRTREARVRTGDLSVPAQLDGVVTAVLGLDDRPQAEPRFRRVTAVRSYATAARSYTPIDLASIYAMPQGADGTGQVIAIIELGGGYREADLAAYFEQLGIPAPHVRAISVDGAMNAPVGTPGSADGEVVLDIEVAGAIAPGADLVVYFAQNTDAGFLDAVSTAAHATPTPTAMSISWGQSEDEWTAQARTALDDAFVDAATLGVTVTAAAGDNGSSDSSTPPASALHVDFPASSPHVLACGGTTLVADPATGTVTSETVWDSGSGRGATGGGVSDAFPLPSWQTHAGVPTSPAGGRGVPDVAADADPATGYRIHVDGSDEVFGGTSAVAPLWAALVCRLTQHIGQPLGLLQPVLYRHVSPGVAQPGLRDVTTGSNGAYVAGPGWDPCTGLGVPADGLLAVVSAQLAP